MSDLERMLENEFTALDVSPEDKSSIMTYLNAIKEKDMSTYEHSIRVGIRSSEIAKYMGFDAKTLFFAGLIHDIGKLKISDKILQKKDTLTEEEMDEMKKHPQYTYDLVKDTYKTPAEIALRHHRYKSDFYPKNLPKSDTFPSSMSGVNLYAIILSLVDVYDALTTRVAYRLGKGKLGIKEVKSVMLKETPSLGHWINRFYSVGFF